MAPRTIELTDGQATIEVTIDGYYGTIATGGTGGSIGPTGPQGIPGQAGPTGPAGVDGVPGTIGPSGSVGAIGPTGPQGIPGTTGEAGSGAIYTNAAPVPVTIGGIGAGSTFDAQTMQQMWDALLYPYQSPSFASFSIQGQSTTIEVGATVAANPTFQWSVNNSANVFPNTTVIRNGSTVLANLVSNVSPYSAVDSAVTKLTATSNTWNIQETNSHGGNFSTSFSVNWRWRVYYGESVTTPLNESQVKALRVSGLQSGFAGTYSFVGGGYKYIAYPVALGTATTFKDTGTNLDVAMLPVYTVSVTNVNGVTVNYNIHRSFNIMGGSINIGVS